MAERKEKGERKQERKSLSWRATSSRISQRSRHVTRHLSHCHLRVLSALCRCSAAQGERKETIKKGEKKKKNKCVNRAAPFPAKQPPQCSLPLPITLPTSEKRPALYHPCSHSRGTWPVPPKKKKKKKKCVQRIREARRPLRFTRCHPQTNNRGGFCVLSFLPVPVHHSLGEIHSRLPSGKRQRATAVVCGHRVQHRRQSVTGSPRHAVQHGPPPPFNRRHRLMPGDDALCTEHEQEFFFGFTGARTRDSCATR